MESTLYVASRTHKSSLFSVCSQSWWWSSAIWWNFSSYLWILTAHVMSVAVKFSSTFLWKDWWQFITWAVRAPHKTMMWSMKESSASQCFSHAHPCGKSHARCTSSDTKFNEGCFLDRNYKHLLFFWPLQGHILQSVFPVVHILTSLSDCWYILALLSCWAAGHSHCTHVEEGYNLAVYCILWNHNVFSCACAVALSIGPIVLGIPYCHSVQQANWQNFLTSAALTPVVCQVQRLERQTQ